MGQNLHLKQVPQKQIEGLLAENALIIDVRAPKEFLDGHIPGSTSIPLLSDQERHLIGIIYKNEGSQQAISQGYQFFSPKQNSIIRQFSQLPLSRPWAVICARGGMRSRVMTQYLHQLGFQAIQVTGGYKAYRRYSLDRFESVNLDNLVVLQGKTGVGKTLVLHRLSQTIDLEGMASHRGSLFGGVGLRPRTQKNFEGRLVQQLDRLDLTKPIFIEGESRKIGPINLPNRLYQVMKGAKTVLLEAPMAVRTARITEEYITCQRHLTHRIREGVTQLKPTFGQQGLVKLLELFDQGDYDRCFETILRDYYDRKYSHSLDQINFLKNFETSDLGRVAQEIETWVLTL